MTPLTLDSYYGALHAAFPDHTPFGEAGLFEEAPWDRDLKVGLLTTPFSHLLRALELEPGLREVSVLVATGAFAPVHDGHIAMLEAARAALEARGERVVQGYVHPDHDAYVIPKVRDGHYDVHHRLAAAQTRVAESSWLEVDPWASLWVPTAVNFTTILERTELYLKRWFPSLTMKVYLVYGGDNAGFAAAFYGHGYGVCVQRGQQDLAAIESQPWFNPARVLHVHEAVSELSSTHVRSLGLPSRMDNPSGTYAVRDDFAESTAQFGTLPDSLRQELLSILADHVPEVATLQPVRYSHALMPGGLPTISLDLYTGGAYNLALSRLFYAGATQHHSQVLIARPGGETLEAQLACIPAGNYELLDDDVASGFTVGYVSHLLAPEREIENIHSLLAENLPTVRIFDIVDMRDFILGAAHGGLVVRTPTGGVGRAPYLFPYVNLATRARIEPQQILPLTRALWVWNQRLHAHTGWRLTHLPAYARQFWLDLGFEATMSLERLCAWHLDRLP